MSKVYDVITDRVIEKLEAGTVPWETPWNGQVGMPNALEIGPRGPFGPLLKLRQLIS